MAKKYSKVREKLILLGLVGSMFVGALTLTGCTSSELKAAQDNIDSTFSEVLNSEEIQEIEKSLFSTYTFLCADVEQTKDNQYSVGINGVANYADLDQKAYTTFNYTVSNSYFADKDEKTSSADIINTLADIVKNENYDSYTISSVKNLDSLNEAMGKVTESPIDYYSYNNNFLYAVGDVQLSESDNTASFSTKELTRFSRTTTTTTIGVIYYSNGKPQYGPVVKTETTYESFFIDNMVYIKLTPEEMELAKTDESIVFDKFVEYVKSKQEDKYVIQQTNVADQKQFDANMNDHVRLEKLD